MRGPGRLAGLPQTILHNETEEILVTQYSRDLRGPMSAPPLDPMVEQALKGVTFCWMSDGQCEAHLGEELLGTLPGQAPEAGLPMTSLDEMIEVVLDRSPEEAAALGRQRLEEAGLTDEQIERLEKLPKEMF